MRFAVLRHQLPQDSPIADHYDLLLEYDGALLTWRLPCEPLLDDEQCSATALPSHRLVYLTYEGPLSGNRGNVHRVAAGELKWHAPPSDLSQPLRATLTAAESWSMTLTPAAGEDANWVVEWHRLR